MCAPVVVCKHVGVIILSARSSSSFVIFVPAAATAPLSLQPPRPSGVLQYNRGLSPGASKDGELVCSFSSLLQEVRQQLNSDHRGKMETLDIDRGCLSLNLKSPNISLKINPTRVPDG